MFQRRAGIAIVVAYFVTAALFAQSTEFGRGSGGEIEAMVKRPSTLSGSFTLSQSLGLSGGGRSYLGTAGGTLLKDRLWFFGSAQINDGMRFQPMLSSYPSRAIPAQAFGSATASIGSRNSLITSIDRGGSRTGLPSSFLSLHYTGLVSSSMFFTANVSRDSVTQPRFITLRPAQ